MGGAQRDDRGLVRSAAEAAAAAVVAVGPVTPSGRRQRRWARYVVPAQGTALLLAVVLVAAACGGAPTRAVTVGATGTTLDAAGTQFTLDDVIPDATTNVLTTVLTVRDTASTATRLTILSVLAQLTDTDGRTYTPDPNERRGPARVPGRRLLGAPRPRQVGGGM